MTWRVLSFSPSLLKQDKVKWLNSLPLALWHGQSCKWAVNSWQYWKALLVPYLQTSDRVGKTIHHLEHRTGKGHGMEAEPSEKYLGIAVQEGGRGKKNHSSISANVISISEMQNLNKHLMKYSRQQKSNCAIIPLLFLLSKSTCCLSN